MTLYLSLRTAALAAIFAAGGVTGAAAQITAADPHHPGATLAQASQKLGGSGRADGSRHARHGAARSGLSGMAKRSSTEPPCQWRRRTCSMGQCTTRPASASRSTTRHRRRGHVFGLCTMLGFRFVARLRDRAPLNADRNDARAQGNEGEPA